MRSPAEGTDDVTVPADSVERSIQHSTADTIKHHIKTAACRVLCDVLVYCAPGIVNENRTQTLHSIALARGSGGIDGRSELPGNLNSHVTNPTGASLDQNAI